MALNAEEHDRLQRILPPGQTVYAYVKETILRTIKEAEMKASPDGPKEIVREMVEALKARKWSLYQMQDYSDRNHKLWLEGRFRKASKSEVLDAISIFRQEHPNDD